MKNQLLLTLLSMLLIFPACEKEIRFVSYSENSIENISLNSTVFIGGRDNKFYAIDAFLNTTKWTFTTGAEIYASTACLLDSIVYIGSTDHKVYALNKNTGAKIWEYNVGWSIYTSPTVKDSILYATGTEYNGGKLVALNAYTGELIWEADTLLHGDFYGSSSPTVHKGVLYTGTGISNSVCALNAATGKLLWKFSKQCAFYSSPCVANDMVYILGADRILYALNAGTGKCVWQFQYTQDMQSLSSSSPTVSGNTVYFIADNVSYLYALDAFTGKVKWRFNPHRSNGIYFSPLAVNETVFTCASNTIFALDSATGYKKWQKMLGNGVISCSPTYANGVVYVTALYDMLYELDADSGTIIGTYNFPVTGTTPVISSPLVENNNGKEFYPSISGMKQ